MNSDAAAYAWRTSIGMATARAAEAAAGTLRLLAVPGCCHRATTEQITRHAALPRLPSVCSPPGPAGKRPRVQAARDRHRARGKRMGRERDQRVQDGRRFRQRKRHKGRPRPMPWQQGRTSCGIPRHALTPSRSRRQITDSRSLRRRQRPRHSPGSPAAVAPPGCRDAPRHIAEALCREFLHAHDAGRSRSQLPVRRPGTAPENRAHRPKKYGVSGSQDRADGATLQLRRMREPGGQTAGDLW